MKIGAIWSIISGLIVLILGSVLGWTDYLGAKAETGGYIFIALGIISLIIGAYDFYKK